MPVERFYIESELNQETHVLLKNEELHHLAHVVRIKEGEIIELLNGKGSLATAQVEKITRQHAELKILSTTTSPTPSYELILAQAIPRQPRLEYILEKAVELGVTKIWLFPGELSEKKSLSPSHLERAHYIITSAMKQCGRLFAPELILTPSLFNWDPTSLPKASFFGDTDPKAKPFLSYLINEKPTSLCIVIGSEKGFNPKETAWMKDTLHLQGVHLHPNILRTDTAAIASLSLASAFIL